MRIAIIFLAAVVLIVLGAWASLVIYFDEARLKEIAVEQVRAQTGRELHLDGPLELRVFPRLSIQAEQVRLSGPADYRGPELFEADRFNLSLRLLPLIRGRVEAGPVTLERAELRLHTDRAGRSSLDDLAGAPREGPAETPAFTSDAVRLRDVAVVITDEAAGTSERFVVDFLELDHFAFDTPLPFRFRGNLGEPPMFERLEVSGRVSLPSGEGPVEITDLDLEGELSGMEIGLTGAMALDAGPPLRAELSDGRMLLDDDAFDLSFSYVDDGRPRVTAGLEGAELDVDALLARFEDPGAGADQPADDAQPLLMFRDTDLDAQLALGRMVVSGLELTDVAGQARARNGVMVIDPLRGALAGGRLDATARIDLNDDPVRVELRPEFELGSLGEALAPWGLDRFLAGAGQLDLELSGHGLEPEQLLRSLSGTGQYELRDGRIHGLDLDSMLTGLQARDVTAAVRAGLGGETAFKQLQGALRLRDGMLNLPELELVTERLGIGGNVSVGLADFALDGQLWLSGERLERMPLALGGSLTSPELTPDIGRAVQQEAGRRVLDLLERRREESGDDNDEEETESDDNRTDPVW